MWEIFFHPAELIATLTGVISVYFSFKKNILTYFFGLISVTLYIFICYNAGIYAEMGINIFYFLMSLYGWRNWYLLFKENEVFRSIQLTLKTNILFFLLTMLVWWVIFYILRNYTDSTIPFLDSFTASFFVTGMILMTIKSIENWVYLIIGNLVTIPLFIYKELYISAVFYLILTVFAFMGFVSWKYSLKKEN
jgi:nicotinamide mononucleotide transporter